MAPCPHAHMPMPHIKSIGAILHLGQEMNILSSEFPLIMQGEQHSKWDFFLELLFPLLYSLF